VRQGSEGGSHDANEGPVIGIDLGTFNSCVAIVEPDGPIVLANRVGQRVTPSMVAVTAAGKRLVGHIAKRQAVTNAESTVHAAKRLIGRKFASPQVQDAMTTVPYRIVEGPNGDPRIELRSHVYSVPEISAMVLQEMKIIAEDYLGRPVSRAVVTVPAYFNDGQRQATKDAGAIAGLEVVRILNEPTAAALAYGFGKNVDRTIAVYDLGGGTFDVSILDITSSGVFKVIATAGDTFLGGEDFDRRIIDWLVEEFQRNHGVDLRQDRMALQRLKDAAEKAKCELSAQPDTEVNLPFIISDRRGEPLHLRRVMLREDLEALTRDLVDRTLAICEQTLEEAGLDKDEIDGVVLVGGMTRMPRVREAVTALFGRTPEKGINPDEVVALGAAIQGAALVDESHDMVLLDVTPHTLGIMIAGGLFEELIPQNSTVPTTRSSVFTTVRDNQTTVKIVALQGESRRAAENELLGEFELRGLPPARAGQVEVEVSFDINADGIVNVRARDLATGRAQSITVTSTSGLTPEEVERMTASANQHALRRRADDAFERVSQRAQAMLAEIQTMLPAIERTVEDGDFGRDALDKARASIDLTNELIAQGDVDALTRQLDVLARTERMFRGLISR
jgi:molecular chaperone DnaK